MTSAKTAVGKVRKFTWEELATYNRRDNAHVAVHGKVYDVSSFIEKHPGGADQIALGAGRDISQIFESYHCEKAFEILEKFYVGDVVSSRFPVYPPSGEFYRTLKGRVERYFRDNKIDPKFDPWMIVRYVFFVSLALIFPFLVIYYQENIPLCILLAALWGFDSALIAFTLMHDSSHYSITHKPWVWRTFGSVHDIFLGASYFMWTHQHILGHHRYTNFNELDPDSFTDPDRPEFLRIKPHQPWLPRYIFQHIYGPLVYCFLGLKTRIEDITYLIKCKSKTMVVTIPTYSQLIQFYLGKFIHVNYRFTLFLFYMPLWEVLMLNLFTELAASYWLAFVIQSSHVVGEVEWFKRDAKMNRHWAEMQVATTQDYATDSWLWTVITGSINHHIAHHLFPGVIQSHCKLITPIVRETCKEFGLPYNYVPTYWHAIGRHFNLLKRLGQKKDNPKQD